MISLLGGSSNLLYTISWHDSCYRGQAVESHDGNHAQILKETRYFMYMIADIAAVPFSEEYFILRNSETETTI